MVKGLSPHTLSQNVSRDTSERRTPTHCFTFYSIIILMDFSEKTKMPTIKKCVCRSQNANERGSWRGRRRERTEMVFRGRRQYKVRVVCPPSLREKKNHSHSRPGSQDSQWHKHVGQTVTISVQSMPCGP